MSRHLQLRFLEIRSVCRKDVWQTLSVPKFKSPCWWPGLLVSPALAAPLRQNHPRWTRRPSANSGRNAQGVRLLYLEPGDKVAAAVVIAPEEEGNGPNGGTLIQ